MWKIIFIIQKPESIHTDLGHRKLLGDCLITISPSLDCISNERIEKLHIALLAHVPLLGTSHWSKLGSYQKCESRFELLILHSHALVVYFTQLPFWKLREIDNQCVTNIDQLKVNINFVPCENIFFWIHLKEKTAWLSVIDVRFTFWPVCYTTHLITWCRNWSTLCTLKY